MMSKIFFLFDSNKSTGYGHLSRCIEIAKSVNYCCIFIGSFSVEAMEFLQVLGEVHNETSIDSSIFLLEKLQLPGDIVLIDNYDFTEAHLKDLNKMNLNWGAFDDFNNLKFEGANFVINFRVNAESWTQYESEKNFVGIEYMPIDKEFLKIRDLISVESTKKAFVCIGSGDLNNIASKVAQVASGYFKEVTVIDSSNRIGQSLNGIENIKVISRVRNVAEQLDGASLAITGGGRLKYECAYANCPVIAIDQTELEEEDSKVLIDKGLLISGGRSWQFEEESLVKGINVYLETRDRIVCNMKNYFERDKFLEIIDYLNSAGSGNV